jgi:proteasome lid subunit RPN8/RPN11
LAEAPLECCGLLGGLGKRVETFHPLRNADSSQTRYSADPADLIAAVRSIRESGAEVVAIYHSHPRWAAIPSRTDLAENFWGDVPRPIISLLDDPPTMRVWRLRPDSYDELTWRVV